MAWSVSAMVAGLRDEEGRSGGAMPVGLQCAPKGGVMGQVDRCCDGRAAVAFVDRSRQAQREECIRCIEVRQGQGDQR